MGEREPCCVIKGSRILETRTRTNVGYEWLPDDVKYRVRKCRKCGTEWATLEGAAEDLITALWNKFKEREAKQLGRKYAK